MKNNDNDLDKEKVFTKTEVEDMLFKTAMDFAKIAKQPTYYLKDNKAQSLTFSKYTKEQIINFLKTPDKNVKNLRDASIYMYNVSSHYRRLINYFAKMPTFAYTLTPHKFDPSKANTKNYMKQYLKAAALVENMQLKHEFQKILTVAFREDVFFGVCWETTDSFFIQRMNPDNCVLSSIEDGVYNFAYDMSKIKETDLFLYPQEITNLYREYQRDGVKMKEIPSNVSIVIKVNEDISFPLPIFSGVLTSLHDIDDFKALSKQRSEIGNYKAMSMKIPTGNDGEPLLDWDLAMKYYMQMVSVLPENIGAIISPMDIQDWNFEKSGNMTDSDEVNKSEEQFWSGAGTSSLLFGGGDKPSSTTLKISIKSDEQIVFAVLSQIERWVNRRLKNMSGSIKFKINMLPVTVFNQQEVIETYTKTSTYGIPVVASLCASLGFSPTDIAGMAFLQNELLKIPSSFIPLSSSHTQSSNSNEGGRPVSEDVTESGEKTKESDSNDER